MLYYTTLAGKKKKKQKRKTMFKRLLQQPVLRVWSGRMHLSLETEQKMTENSAIFFFFFPRVTLQFCALLIRPWMHLIQTPKTAKYVDYFSPFNYWSACMSASRCFLSWQQLFLPCLCTTVYFLYTTGVTAGNILPASYILQWLTTCLKQCQPVIMHNKGIVCFCLQIFWKAGSPFKAIRG